MIVSDESPSYSGNMNNRNSDILKALVILLSLSFIVLAYRTAKADEYKDSTQDTNQTSLSFKQRIEQRLDTIILDKVSYEAVPMSEVLKQLERESKARDPKKRGIHFLIHNPPDSGLPNSQPSPPLGDMKITIIPALQDVSLRQLVEAIAKVTPRPVQYSIEDYGVVFTERPSPKEALHTRTFKLGPKLFAELNAGDLVKNCVRVFQRECGVDMMAPGRSISVKERMQILMFRGTLAELDRVEKYISKKENEGQPLTL